MGYIREIYKAGATLVIREKMKRRVEKNQKRAPKTNHTTEKVWLYNLKQAAFKLTLILNENFVPGDHHLQLTYKIEPASREEAKKDRSKFLRKVTNECKKRNIDFKWVAITEKTGGRFHHHIVCSNIPVDIIKKCWSKEEKGTAFHNPLWDFPNYADLAEYLIKEAAQLHTEEGSISKKRYTTSKNIIVPEGRQVEITRKSIEDEPTVFKNFDLDTDSVQVYENELTDTICREYILIARPEAKYRSKGTKITGEYVNYSKALRKAYREEQLSFWEEIQ